MPTLSKTYYSSNNRALDDTSTAARVAASVLFALKATLMGQVSGTDGPEGARPVGSYWTLYASSDSSTAGVDSTDRIGSTFNAAKWVRVAAGGTPHTWFVLKSPTTLLDGPWYLCVDYIGADDHHFSIGISRQPFSGGAPTTSARPTSTNESFFTAQDFNDASVNPGKTHYTCDDNGGFWFDMSRNGVGFTQLTIAVLPLIDARSSDAARSVLFCSFNATTPGSMEPSLNLLFKGVRYDNSAGLASTEGRLVNLTFSGSSWGALQTNTNANDAKLDLLPVAYCFDVSTAHIGMRGRLPDVWYIGKQVAPGSAVPSTGQQNCTVIGGILRPCSIALSM